MTHPFIKSIRPVNLLSFGPEAEPIELRSLNILIGPNGSGKSNFIEIIRLLHVLPNKDPWSSVLATGGVSEWVWKGKKNKSLLCALHAQLSLGDVRTSQIGDKSEYFNLSINLELYESSFRIKRESIGTSDIGGNINTLQSWFERDGPYGTLHLRMARADEGPIVFGLNTDRSVIAQLASPSVQASNIGQILPELFEIAEFLESFDFHQDWEFGVDCPPRDPQPVGQSIVRLEENGINLAQMLAHYKDDHKPVFERLTDLVRRFYEPVKSVEVRVVSTHLQVAIEEIGGFSVPAYRLSDGMLRWLAILAILLNPTPPPVTCIDEPELGLHPDIIPTLADLLREASMRTQLIVTTHSTALVDAFSDDPEVICVSEKIDGSTVIRRLSQPDLAVWLKDYSLGNLWASGEIGGNRW
ncbi:AAA family ATPase [Granulicella mallensis]|uniref:Putative ATPase n=1 Tax=Granulicella mallensis TaxID=940614 RepID=A0A7W7ZR57_9BACT|nr:AAA family ATPase [Granulicella mallensis]MBB5064289.1 putative ATPase [Granulicella mallensis]